MRLTLIAALAATALAGCAQTPPVDTTPAPPMPAEPSNPFFVESTLPYKLPPFDRIDDADFLPAFEAGMQAHAQEIAAIAHDPDAPTFENTIVRMETSGEVLGRVSAVFYNLASSDTNETIQQVQAEMAPRLSAHRDSIFLNPQLYARVKALYDQRDDLGLDAESARLLERYHTTFVRAGAQLDPAQKDRLREINEQLSSATTLFQQNLLKDTNELAIAVDDVALLDGLEPDTIASAAQAAKERGLEGQWLLTLSLPTQQPMLSSLKNRDLRLKIQAASESRGANGNAYDNRDTLLKIVRLRAERAELFGYPHHAAYVLEESTARTTEAVNERLASVAPAAVANARAEAADMQALIDEQGGDFELAAADWAYYAEAVRKARYAFDESQLRPYLELGRVLEDGAFFMAKELYGLTFTERTDLPVYHPDVRLFEVFDTDGSAMGLFLFDPFARPSKRGGAWMNSFVDQSALTGDKPVVVNNLNVPKPPEGDPVLLTFDEANTLFHEFGHALHGLMSDVTYPYFSGTSVPRDFVEYPSQVHEMWATWPEVLANYAVHYQTGEPMPQELVDKIEATKKFNQGFATTEYLAASLLDQAWHQLSAEEAAAVDDVVAFEQAALEDAGVDFAPVPPRYRSPYFAHVFAGGYSAGYYSYIWSEVLDADTVEWFKENGGLRLQNGQWFRDKLLSRGGSVEAMDLFRDFRGRDPDITPLLERRGLTPPEN